MYNKKKITVPGKRYVITCNTHITNDDDKIISFPCYLGICANAANPYIIHELNDDAIWLSLDLCRKFLQIWKDKGLLASILSDIESVKIMELTYNLAEINDISKEDII